MSSSRRGAAAVVACVAGWVLALGGGSPAVAQESDPASPSPGQPQPSEPAPPALGNETYVEYPPETAPRGQSSAPATIPVEEPPPVVEEAPAPPPAVVAVPPAPVREARPAAVPEASHRKPTHEAKGAAAQSDDHTSSRSLIQAGLVALTAVLLVAGFWPSKKSPYLSTR
jgi:hypothetical protein